MRHRSTLAPFLFAAYLLISPLAPVTQAQTSDPTTQPRVQSGDITYLGFFTVPAAPATGFTYGGMGVALGADNNSLYYGGHVNNPGHTLGRISIPAIGGTAAILQNPTAVPGSPACGGTESQLAGAFVWNNRLIVTKRCIYTQGNYSSITVGSIAIGGFSPLQTLAGVPGTFSGGYMGVIPTEWRTLLGGPAFMGNGVMSINSNGTNGPSFYVFNPDNVNVVAPVPNFPLMNFPYSAGCATCLANPDVANDLFSRSNYYNAGIVFPQGTRSVLFFHRQGYGSPTYKVDDGCGGSGGEGARPYRRQVTAFDANDLLAVKNGTKLPYQVRPYAWWVLPGPTDSCAAMSGYANGGYSFAWQESTRRIYGVLDQGDTTRVHVWQVANLTGGTPPAPTPSPTPTPTPPPPPASTKFSINDRVQVTTGTLNVRSTPSTSGTLLGSQPVGVLGTVIGGPTAANGFNWWSINFDSGADGWAVEDNLVQAASVISVFPATPTFTGAVGGSRPPPINVTVSVSNSSSWSSSDTCTFFDASPTSGASGGSHTLTPSAGWDSLAAGTYTCPITYSASGNASRVVQVTAVKQAGTPPPPAPTPTPPPPTTLSGDLNADGSVNALDLQLEVNVVLGLSTNAKADLNGDGVANALDLQRIVNAVLGL